MSTSAAAAVFEAADANHDGVLTQAEFAAATAPVVYTTGSVTTAAPVYYTTAPAEMAEAPIIYSSAAPVTYAAAPMIVATDTYQPGERIIYTSVTTGNTYPGSVVDMYTDGGCQIILDIDGGFKDLYLQDMVRLTKETATTEAPAAAAVKSKKAKKVKSKKMGCC